MSDIPLVGDPAPSPQDFDDASEILRTGGLERVFIREPPHRMTFHVALSAGGEVDRSALRKAWLQTVARHPRLWAKLDDDHRRFQTDLGDVERQNRMAACWHPEDREATGDEPAALRPKLGPPVRLRLRFVDGRSVMHFSFHHAVCDGIGASRLIYETLRTFSGQLTHRTKRLSGERPAMAQGSDASASRQTTDTKPVSIKTKWKHFRVTTRGHNARLPDHFPPSVRADPSDRHPIRGNRSDDESHHRTFLGHPVVCFSRMETDLVIAGCRHGAMPLNDLAVASSIAAISTMIRNAPNRHICVMNPVDRRQWRHRREIRNHLGLAFIRRELHRCDDHAALLGGVHDQLDYVRKNDVSGEFEATLSAFERVPMAVPMLRRTGWFAPTFSLTCLSNLQFGARSGTINRAADDDRDDADWIGSILQHPLYALDVVPPIPPQCSTALAIWRCGHRIAMSVRTTETESKQFWPRELLRRWSESLKNYAGGRLANISERPSRPEK